MSGEIMEGDTLFSRLFEAAEKEDWTTIDETLIPQLAGMDQNQAAKVLLKRVKDSDSNIRDVVATGLGALTVSDPQTKDEITKEMVAMATLDTEVFPAGRAAVYLLRHQEESQQVKEALETFKTKARRQNWVSQLTENIPQLQNQFQEPLPPLQS